MLSSGLYIIYGEVGAIKLVREHGKLMTEDECKSLEGIYQVRDRDTLFIYKFVDENLTHQV